MVTTNIQKSFYFTRKPSSVSLYNQGLMGLIFLKLNMAKKGKRVVKSTPGKPPVYEPEQAAGCEDEPEAGPATEATVRPGPVSEPDIEEYPQPEDW